MGETAGNYLVAQCDPSRCVRCGMCLKVCPSYSQNQPVASIRETCEGTCLSGYIGYACKNQVRREGQSGGVVTALLMYLLDSGKIDAAVTTRFCPETGGPQTVLSTTPEELMASCGSYYTQTAAAKTALDHSNQRLAAVVLGCQSKALKLAQEQGMATPEYLIGLICAGQNSRDMITDLSQLAKIPPHEQLRTLRFKYSHPAYGGWPGNTLMVTDRHRYTLDKRFRLKLKFLYESYRCLLCYDQMNVNADLVCGDPWHIPGDHTAGETVVIARTEKGVQLLQQAMDAGYLSLTPLEPEQILKGQTVYPRHVHKVGSGYQVCQKFYWEYPYQLSEKAARESQAPSKKVVSGYQTRLQYTRARFLAKSREEIDQLTQAYQIQLEKKERMEKQKSIFLFPIRVLRYIKRKFQGN